MLTAYDQCDGETVERIIKSPLFRYMDNDVSTIWQSRRWVALTNEEYCDQDNDPINSMLIQWLPLSHKLFKEKYIHLNFEFLHL